MRLTKALAILVLLSGALVLPLAGCGPSVDTGYGSTSGNNNGSGNNLTGPGYTWEQETSGTTTSLRSVCYTNNRWVAVGTGGGVGVTAESTDGKTWALTQFTATATYYLHYVGCGNNTFVALASSAIIYSGDGVGWGQASITTPDASTYPQEIAAVTYGNGVWVAVDDLFFTENGWGFLTSTDGGTWNENIVTGPYAQPTGITYGNGLYVVVGYGGLVLTSPDAITWTNQSLSSGTAIKGITFVNGKFYAVTIDGHVLISTDAVNWTSYTLNYSYPNGIAYGGSVFLTYGALSGGTMEVSADGQNWTNATSYLPTSLYNNAINGVAYGNGTFVAVGDGGSIGITY